jgi:hypothetical protein
MVKGAEWETRFAAFAKLDPRVVATQVRIWPEVHLRGLYSNLGGFLAENGFALDKRRALAVSWQNERQAHAALHSNLKDYRQQHVFTLPPSEAKSFPQNDLGRQ